jgi:hypothetical protein
MTVNLLAFAGAISMFVLVVVVFSLWFERRSPFGDSCLARVGLFVTGFGTGFLAFWAFAPDNLTSIICIGPLIGLGVGGYTGVLMPTIVPRPLQKSSRGDSHPDGESVTEKDAKPIE